MKKLITLASLLLVQCIAQHVSAQQCTTPMNDVTFQTAFNQVAVLPTNETKFGKAIALLNGNCMSALQVKNMSQLFTDDAFRLDYCKLAYSFTVDKDNYYEVYDAFHRFSMAFRLHDYVEQTKNTSWVGVEVSTPVNNDPVFPSYTYPSYLNYTGKKGCAGPAVSEEVFKNLAKNVNNQPSNEAKFVNIQFAAEQNCLNMAQQMKLISLINDETIRLKIAKQIFSRVFDQDNYEYAKALFTNEANKTDWINHCKMLMTPPPPVCTVTDADFKKLHNDIKAKTFTDEKMTAFKLIAKDRCFNVEQIRTISKEFPFGDEKLTVFKTSYTKCTNQKDYYKLMDELSFSSEKDDLKAFIEKK